MGVEARISRQENSERSWEEIDHRLDHARNQEEIFETVQDLIAEQFDLDIDQPEP